PSAGASRSAPRHIRSSLSVRPWPRLETTPRCLCPWPRPARLRGSARGSFFKSLLRRGVLFRMKRPGLQPGQLQQVQPLGHRSLVYPDREALLYLVPQVDAAPADDLVRLRVRSADHQLPELRHLRLGQPRRWARADPRRKPRYTLGVVAMHPVPQGLALHPALLRGLGPRLALQDQRKRHQPPHNRPVLVLRHQPPQIPCRMILVRDRNRPAHRPLLANRRPAPGDMVAPDQEGGTTSSISRSSGLAVCRSRPLETCV